MRDQAKSWTSAYGRHWNRVTLSEAQSPSLSSLTKLMEPLETTRAPESSCLPYVLSYLKAHGFINKLIQLTYEKPNKSRGKKKGKQALRRPIICICNNLYASSLAKLRPIARLIRFTRPANIHVVKRLRDICDVEGLRTDSRALSTLVGIGLGDLRGCLNTLQVALIQPVAASLLPDRPLPSLSRHEVRM